MIDINPRKKRHFKSLFGGVISVIMVFAISYYVLPDSWLNSSALSVFTFSISIVSIFIAIYSFTSPEHWYPEDVRHIVLSSDPTGWDFREIDEGEQIVLKDDRSISIQTTRISGVMDYHEIWMDVYAKTEGTRYKASIFKNDHEYDYCYLVWVDGKTLIPEPTSWGGDTVTELGYHVGRLIEMARAEGIRPSAKEQEKQYDDTLEMAGITVED